MELLFDVNAKTITKLATIGALGTIFLCYFIAVSQGHVPVWIPMISDCAVYPPESYFFRGGMISSAVLLNIVTIFMLCYRKIPSFNKEPSTSYSTFDEVAYAFATIASIGLAIVGSVNEVENGSIHGTGAVLFFAFYLIYMCMITVRLWDNSNHNSTSMIIKCVLTIIAFVSLVSLGIMALLSWHKYRPEIALCEWTGTISIILFLFSFIFEYGDALKAGALIQSSVISVQSLRV